MSKLRVLSFGLSLDGYGAGPNQNLTHPLGENFFHGLDLRALGYECETSIAGERATHIFIRRKKTRPLF